MSEAAFELHSSRLVTPTCSRRRPMILKVHDLNGLAGFGHAVPSKRSSPPAAKFAVCIGGAGRSQGASSRNCPKSPQLGDLLRPAAAVATRPSKERAIGGFSMGFQLDFNRPQRAL